MIDDPAKQKHRQILLQRINLSIDHELIGMLARSRSTSPRRRYDDRERSRTRSDVHSFRAEKGPSRTNDYDDSQSREKVRHSDRKRDRSHSRDREQKDKR